MRINKNLMSLGIVLLVISIFQALMFKEPHFYSLFSIGLALIFYQIYTVISGKEIFQGWSKKQHIFFWILLIVASFIIDQLGMKLGYWIYPHYFSFLDEFVKITLEYAVAFVYILLFFLIGKTYFEKKELSKLLSAVLSLVIFVTFIGLFTEIINMQVNSWQVLSMPLTNFKIGNFFIVWQTIGFWLMAVIPYIIYKFVRGSGK